MTSAKLDEGTLLLVNNTINQNSGDHPAQGDVPQ